MTARYHSCNRGKRPVVSCGDVETRLIVESETRNMAVIRPSLSSNRATSPMKQFRHISTLNNLQCISSHIRHLAVQPSAHLTYGGAARFAPEREASGLRYSPTSPMDRIQIVQFGIPVGKRIACWTSSSPARIIMYIRQTLSILRGEAIQLCEHNKYPSGPMEQRRLH